MNKKWSFAFIGITLFLLMMGTNLPTPLYGVYQRLWHFSPAMLTLIFACYALVLIPTLLLFGNLSDRLGRKRTLFIGVTMALVGSIILMEAHHVEWLMISRVFQGIGIALTSGTASAALTELNNFSKPRVSALTSTVTAAGGTAVGPLFSGLIAQYGPDPLSLPYELHILLLFPCLIVIPFIPETVNIHIKKRRMNRKIKIPQPFLFMTAGLASFVSWAVIAIFISVVPSYITALLHVTNLAIVGGIVCLMLTCSVVTQLFFRKMPNIRSMILGLALLIVGLGSMIAAVPFHSMVLVLSATIISGAGSGLSFMGSMAMVNEFSPKDIRGQVFSLYYAIVYLGVGAPVIGVGVMATRLGWFPAIVLFASILSLVGVFMIFLLKYKWSHTETSQVHLKEVPEV